MIACSDNFPLRCRSTRSQRGKDNHPGGLGQLFDKTKSSLGIGPKIISAVPAEKPSRGMDRQVGPHTGRKLPGIPLHLADNKMVGRLDSFSSKLDAKLLRIANRQDNPAPTLITQKFQQKIPPDKSGGAGQEQFHAGRTGRRLPLLHKGLLKNLVGTGTMPSHEGGSLQNLDIVCLDPGDFGNLITCLGHTETLKEKQGT
jgi:hypothetical protein